MAIADSLTSQLRQDTKLASVCTEPAAVAFACARARQLLAENVDKVFLELSSGIMKNCMHVGLPRTKRRGPAMAAALGITGGDPARQLDCLQGVCDCAVDRACELVDNDVINVKLAHDCDHVYVKTTVVGETKTATVVLQGSHATIASEYVDGALVFQHEVETDERKACDCNFEQLLTTLLELDTSDYDYVWEGALATGGGFSLDKRCRSEDELFNVVSEQVLSRVQLRMSGQSQSVLTSGGSGNQGILVAVPVLRTGELLQLRPDQIHQALLIAHGVNVFIKGYWGKVSPFCGAVSAAGGVAAGISWMFGKSVCVIEQSVQAVLGVLFGMMCDGAKASCGPKCVVGATGGCRAGLTREPEKMAPAGQGLVGQDLVTTLGIIQQLSCAAESLEQQLLEVVQGHS